MQDEVEWRWIYILNRLLIWSFANRIQVENHLNNQLMWASILLVPQTQQ